MGSEHISTDKLGHAYAVTAHRSQGATVDVTYALEDGGGRELAYVAMSRARHESHVHVVAPDAGHAAERLAWAWEQQKPPDVGAGQRAGEVARGTVRRAQPAGRPPSHATSRLSWAKSASSSARLDQDARDLGDGTGRWAGTRAGEAARAAREAALVYQQAQAVAAGRGPRPLGKAQGSGRTEGRRRPLRRRRADMESGR